MVSLGLLTKYFVSDQVVKLINEELLNTFDEETEKSKHLVYVYNKYRLFIERFKNEGFSDEDSKEKALIILVFPYLGKTEIPKSEIMFWMNTLRRDLKLFEATLN